MATLDARTVYSSDAIAYRNAELHIDGDIQPAASNSSGLVTEGLHGNRKSWVDENSGNGYSVTVGLTQVIADR